MKPKTFAFITAMTVVAVLALPTGLAAQEQGAEPRYSVTELGTLGGTSSVAYSVNHKGWIAGAASLGGNTAEHAVLWRNGGVTDLGTLGGPNSTAFFPLNDRGEVSGFSDTANADPNGEDFCGFGTHLVCNPFVWQNGVKTVLPTLGGNNAIANEVNNRGRVGGVAETKTVDPTCVAPQVLQALPVVWKNGQLDELPTFAGDPDGFVNAINDSGQAVGASGQCYTAQPGIHALLWGPNGSITDLGNLGGTMNHFPQDINNQGQVVGFSNLPNNATTHGFLWENGTMTDLGTLPGDFWSFAFSINSNAQVVGQSCNSDFSVCRAFLWQKGVMTDLNSLISAGSAMSLLVAYNVNDRGEITGQAFDQNTGATPAFLATPEEGSCEAASSSVTQVTSAPRKVALPEKVRKQLRRQARFSRFEATLTRPQ